MKRRRHDDRGRYQRPRPLSAQRRSRTGQAAARLLGGRESIDVPLCVWLELVQVLQINDCGKADIDILQEVVTAREET